MVTLLSVLPQRVASGELATIASLLLAFTAMAYLFAGSSLRTDSSHRIARTTAGKAIVCIYRTYRFAGPLRTTNYHVNDLSRNSSAANTLHRLPALFRVLSFSAPAPSPAWLAA